MEKKLTMADEAGPGEQVFPLVSAEDDFLGVPTREDALIEAIDQKDFLIKHAEWVEKVRSSKLDVQSALGDMSPDMLIQLAYMALSKDVSHKTRLVAIQDWLDRAGYSKVQKIAAAVVDPNAPKQQLISLIESLGKKNKVIEVVEGAELLK